MSEFTGIVYDGELLDWGFNWSAALPSGDTVLTSTWDVGDELITTRETLSDGVAVVWVTNFTGGSTYQLLNHLTMASGREYEKTIVLQCIDTGLGGGVTVVSASGNYQRSESRSGNLGLRARR